MHTDAYPDTGPASSSDDASPLADPQKRPTELVRLIEVPIQDMVAEFEAQKPELLTAVTSVFRTGDYIQGAAVVGFEGDFAGWLGADHAVACKSGLDALHLILRGLGIGPGDEVIVPAYGQALNAVATQLVGGTPVFGECERDTFALQPESVERAITTRTAAIIVAHQFGQAARIEPTLEVASDRGIPVVESCIGSLGGKLGDRYLGTLGTAAAFSFGDFALLTGVGDGGACVTADADLAARLTQLRRYGANPEARITHLGIYSELDTIQAAVLRVKLPTVQDKIAAQRTTANRYRDAFRAHGLTEEHVKLPVERRGTTHAYVSFVVRVAPRVKRAVYSQLMKKQVGVVDFFPTPLHQHPALQTFPQVEGGLPVAEELSGSNLAVPIYPELTDRQIGYVVSILQSTLKAEGAL